MTALPDVSGAFPEPYAKFGGTLGVTCPGAVPLADLLCGSALADTARCYAAGFPGGAGPAVLSMWSQFYLLSLVPCAAAFALVARRDLPVSAAGMGVLLAPSGQPTGLSLPHGGCPCRAACPVARLTPLLRDHLEPLADALGTAGLPPRVFWSNAGKVLAWTLRVLDGQPEELAAVRSAMCAPCWADGAANPLRSGIRPGAAGPERQVCCLRFRLPGMALCGDCPRQRGRN